MKQNVWLGNDWHLAVNDFTRSIENPGHEADATEDFLTKSLPAEKFHNIRDRMLGEHTHIAMLNATGTKKAKACHLDPFYMYLDTFFTFHQHINLDTVDNIHMVSCGLKSHSNGGVSHTN